MLFETLKQSYIFLGCLYFGILIGIVKDICNFIVNLFKNKKIIIFILDFIFMIMFTFMFIICINIVNYGELRIFLLIGYILGFITERKTIGFLVDFLIKKIYNFLKFMFSKLLKFKIFKRIIGFDTKSSKKTN